MRDTSPIKRRFLSSGLTIRGREFTWGARTYLMGVINVTPDSFSGDGIGEDPMQAAALGQAFEAAGADLIDLGAESSRPGGEGVSGEEERRRLLPALESLRKATDLPISVDTWRSETAAAALAGGADIVNDIHGMRRDPAIAAVVARCKAPVILMHNQRGRPVTDVVTDIVAGFDASLRIAAAAGVEVSRLVLDPGFGFGWTPEQNLEMVRRLPELWACGLPLLVGVSRKSTLGAVLNTPAQDRLEATISAVALAVAGGADVVRVHDLQEVARAVRIADAIARGSWRVGS